MKILANDGIDATGKSMLEAKGFTVDTNKIPQNELASRISEYDVLLVRSATKVNREIIDAATNLKAIGRAGVGIDNIDARYAAEKNIPVFNTPAASSRSVAELVFAHMFGMCRSLPLTNRGMYADGANLFNDLKKTAAKGVELEGKTLGIIGFGRIGQEVAKMAIGLGMDVMVNDYKLRTYEITMSFHRKFAYHNFKLEIKPSTLQEVLAGSDFVSLHVPGGAEPIIGAAEIALMKKGAGLINCSRGGVVDEPALVNALNSGHLAYAGVDVFQQEPPVYLDILKLDNVSLSPHIGAQTMEAQSRVGIEMAEKILRFFNKI